MNQKTELPEEEALGLRLLKKGRKGVFKLVFSRMGVILLLLIVNALLLLAAFAWFEDFLPGFYGASAVLTVAMVLYLINGRMDPTAKITWLILIMLLPVFSSLLYLYTRMDVGHRTMKSRLQKIYAASGSADVQTAAEALAESDGGAAGMVRYVSGVTGIPLCGNTEVSYFSYGEELFEPMLAELEKAEKSIYLEFFIVEEGVMWGRILEVLARKAAQGVDVRMMYDGTCEFFLLPKDYPKKLRSLNIACRVFAPITPFVSTHYNYRDHRKILTIDGKVAFTGGVNLADEYINAKEIFGYWKDTAVLLRGDAVKGFERMFLQMWNLEEKHIYFPEEHPENRPVNCADGFVLPYFEDPLDEEHIGRQVYVDILNRARSYVHIMTPYLILDGELESALKYAAKRGVDVTLLLPGIPDKKIPYAFAKSHYPALLAAGVKIYEYTPGFVHAKVVVSDDREAVVGTINFDYRSLYHHFECAAYMYGVACIEDIVKDFEASVAKAQTVTPQSIKSEKLFYKVCGRVLKVIAPLL